MTEPTEDQAQDTAEAGDGEGMDIHKPKAAHSWREFAIEIGTIICGILIALGLEQGIEALHWNEKVAAAEEREHTEVDFLYRNALERTRIAGCLDRRLDQLKSALLSSQGAWKPLPVMGGMANAAVVIVPHRNWFDQVWRSILADGTASHLRPERQIAYSGLFMQVGSLGDLARVETEDAAALELLANPLTLSGDMRNQLVQRIEAMRARNFYVAVIANQAVTSMERLGPLDKAKAEAFLLVNSNAYYACSTLGLLPAGAPVAKPVSPEVSRRMRQVVR